ncbi:MAG: hypothetical protein FD165_841 [Gammaproteobacteria bacterium]|nr:MAG: hypothetical protein FD165_841 [Gammaproteobacteria bacterium]
MGVTLTVYSDTDDSIDRAWPSDLIVGDENCISMSTIDGRARRPIRYGRASSVLTAGVSLLAPAIDAHRRHIQQLQGRVGRAKQLLTQRGNAAAKLIGNEAPAVIER